MTTWPPADILEIEQHANDPWSLGDYVRVYLWRIAAKLYSLRHWRRLLPFLVLPVIASLSLSAASCGAVTGVRAAPPAAQAIENAHHVVPQWFTWLRDGQLDKWSYYILKSPDGVEDLYAFGKPPLSGRGVMVICRNGSFCTNFAPARGEHYVWNQILEHAKKWRYTGEQTIAAMRGVARADVVKWFRKFNQTDSPMLIAMWLTPFTFCARYGYLTPEMCQAKPEEM